MSEENEANPYEAPSSAPADSPFEDEQRRSIDYPGGIRTVLILGLLGGVIVGTLFGASSLNGTGEVAILLSLVLWCGAFVALALMLPGSAGRKAARGIFALVLSFPALILYVPTCGFTFAMVTSVTKGEGIGFFSGSVVAFTLILCLFASIIRQNARITHRVVPNQALRTETESIEQADPFGTPDGESKDE